MKKYNSPYVTLLLTFTIFSPALGMKNLMTQSTIEPSPSEISKKSNFYSLQNPLAPLKQSKPKVIFWLNDPKKEITYIDEKNWSIPTKTYLLQLLWSNAKQTRNVESMKNFGDALHGLNQKVPSLSYDAGKKPTVNFTYQLAKIPKDSAPEIKTLLWSSLNKEQREAYRKRIMLETILHENDAILKEYKTSLQNKSQARQEKINLLKNYKKELKRHTRLLEGYLLMLQSHEEALKTKIKNDISVYQTTSADIQNKIDALQNTETKILIENRAQDLADQVNKQRQLDEIDELVRLEEIKQQNDERNRQDQLKEQIKKEREQTKKSTNTQNIEKQPVDQGKKQQEIKTNEWRPWITNKFNALQQSIGNFFSYLRSWWPF